MKCPDCAGLLMEVALTGIEKSFQCFGCGGVWTLAKTVNGLPDTQINTQLHSVEVNSEKLKSGDNKCPHDQSNLEFSQEKTTFQELGIRQCPACHWWWFPGNSLSKYRPIQEEEKAQMAKKGPGLAKVMKATVPVLSLALLLAGGVIGVKMLRGEQKVNVSAEALLRDVSGMKFDQGEVEIVFIYEGEIKSGVQVFLADEMKWVPVMAVKLEGNRYQISFGKMLGSDEEIKIKVNGEEALVQIRSVKPE